MDGPGQAAQTLQTDALPRRVGDFTVDRKGSGGSGVVYAAQWGHRDVAPELPRADLVATDTERKRFLDEARALAEIDHAAVVKVLHFGELPDRRPFLATELVAETLAARLQALSTRATADLAGAPAGTTGLFACALEDLLKRGAAQ
jgi:eukaryotic-like serine/threonine-protein kinase